MEIQGRVFLLTGASRGIGRSLAEALATSGARLVLSARTTDDLERVARTCRASGADVRAVVGDVGRDADAARMVETAHQAFGHIDVLINNAAVLLSRAPLKDVEAEVWEQTLRVNVVGTANMIRHVLPAMEERRDGLIVNVTSTWGREAAPLVAPYCASKFAVEALTRSVSMESGPGVVVCAANPGVIATDMLADAFGGDVSAYPGPEALTPRWLRLLEEAGPALHGRSIDL